MQARRGADGPDDERLILLAQAGDGAALAQLLRRYEGLLRRTVWRTLGSGRDVDDVLQETALQIWQHIGTLREPAAAPAWMARIAHNTAIGSAIRNRVHDELTQESVVLEGPDRDVERFDLHRDLTAALARIPPVQAEVWLLREIDGLSYREIALRLGTSESTVRGSLVSARRRLHEMMSKTCAGERAAQGALGADVESSAPQVAVPAPAGSIDDAPRLARHAHGRAVDLPV